MFVSAGIEAHLFAHLPMVSRNDIGKNNLLGKPDVRLAIHIRRGGGDVEFLGHVATIAFFGHILQNTVEYKVLWHPVHLSSSCSDMLTMARLACLILFANPALPQKKPAGSRNISARIKSRLTLHEQRITNNGLHS